MEARGELHDVFRQLVDPGARGRGDFVGASTGIGGAATKKIDPQCQDQFRTATAAMRPTVQITQAVESFDGQSQATQKPADQHTVGVVMTDMLEAVMGLGFVEALVFDFPAALGH